MKMTTAIVSQSRCSLPLHQINKLCFDLYAACTHFTAITVNPHSVAPALCQHGAMVMCHFTEWSCACVGRKIPLMHIRHCWEICIHAVATKTYMNTHLSANVCLQMVLARRVSRQLPTLFTFTSLSVYTSLNAACMHYIYAVSQECVTASHPWLILMAEHTARTNYK